MRIQLIGHASVLVSTGEIRLLSDPWLSGRAFAEGWEQSPLPYWRPEQLDCTHLWISHEHPDHLSVETLRAVPEAKRRSIQVVVQRSLTGEMSRFLRELGWGSVIELGHRERHDLGGGVTVQLHQFGLVDSSLTVSRDAETVVLLNDCKPTRWGLRRLRQDVGSVSVLFDQYSIAAWAGNPGDTDRYATRRKLVLDHLAQHVEMLDPELFVPYASSVRFCQPDNVHMNDAVVTRAMVEQRLGGRNLLWLEPGQELDPRADPPVGLRPAAPTGSDVGTGQERDQEPDQQPAEERAEPGPPIIELAELRVDELLARTPTLLARRLRPLGFRSADDSFPPFVFDPQDALTAGASADCVVVVGGDAARAALGYRWGLETLSISGRFRLEGDESIFQQWKQLAAGVSAGLVCRPMRNWLLEPERRDFLRRRGFDFAMELVRKVR